MDAKSIVRGFAAVPVWAPLLLLGSSTAARADSPVPPGFHVSKSDPDVLRRASDNMRATSIDTVAGFLYALRPAPSLPTLGYRYWVMIGNGRTDITPGYHPPNDMKIALDNRLAQAKCE